MPDIPTALPNLSFTASESQVLFETKTERVTVSLPEGGQSFIASKFLITREDLVNSVTQKFDGSQGQHLVVGEGNTTRDVYHWVSSANGKIGGIRAGLTVHQDVGTQSSLPHDFELNLELGFEEVFFYIINGGRRARAVQVGHGMWHDGRRADAVWPVVDRSFSVIPMGYHPVMAEPQTKVGYLWAYICKYPRWEKA